MGRSSGCTTSRRKLSAPFPLLAAIAVRTSRIEIGTGVIDLRYENPLYMAEEAAVADLLSGGRLQLGVSRGSPEPAYRGADAFGYSPPEGLGDSNYARAKVELFRAAIAGAGVVRADAGGGRARACSRSSRGRPACRSASGGDRARARPLPGQPRRG